MVFTLILLNAAIYVADLLFAHRISDALALQPDLFQKPWQFWQLLTYGFVHDPNDLKHILFNMFGLWLFGTDVEHVYGRAEFLRFYLCTIVVAGLVWVATATAAGGAPLVGASGGIMGVMILFVMHFPRRIFYIWGLLPLPAWGMAALYVLIDVMGAMHSTDRVAHSAHLAGVAFGFIYFRTGLNLGRLVPRRLADLRMRWRPRLRIHDPDEQAHELSQKVDTILEKISRQGEASLTKSERRTLEEASRRYQRRRE